jgi:hypothetical protein
LVDLTAPGAGRRLTAEQEAELAAVVEAGPDIATDGVVRWRCLDLKDLIRRRWGVDYHQRTIGKSLARLGFSHVSARPRHHGQGAHVIETFKQTFPERLAEIVAGLPPGTSIEVWFQDEMVNACVHRPEEPVHPPLGAARQPAAGVPGPAHRLGLSVRGDLP